MTTATKTAEYTATTASSLRYVGTPYRFARQGEYVIGIARREDDTLCATARHKYTGDVIACECAHRTARGARKCLGLVRREVK